MVPSWARFDGACICCDFGECVWFMIVCVYHSLFACASSPDGCPYALSFCFLLLGYQRIKVLPLGWHFISVESLPLGCTLAHKGRKYHLSVLQCQRKCVNEIIIRLWCCCKLWLSVWTELVWATINKIIGSYWFRGVPWGWWITVWSMSVDCGVDKCWLWGWWVLIVRLMSLDC